MLPLQASVRKSIAYLTLADFIPYFRTSAFED